MEGGNMEYDICVVGGGGHVGLPLSIAFADKGKKVVIYDINKDCLTKLQNGEMPFIENGCEVLLKRNIGKNLFLSSSPDVVSHSKFIIIIIGTPVDEHLNPNHEEMNEFFKYLVPYLQKNQVVILRSTVFPGTTKRLRRILREAVPGVEVCFACERILEGKAMEELYSLPQIIAGEDAVATNAVLNLFRLLTNEVIVTGTTEAELTKLFTNSWRYIQFATANQFYTIAEQYGANFYQIYDAMTRNYPRAKNFPKPGFAAGPCLFKDTMQLNAFCNNQFFLGHSAMLINEGLPNFVVQMLKRECALSEKTVGILGMAFKAESDDSRESLSYKLRKLLSVEARKVFCSDPYIKDPRFIDVETLIEESDIVIIAAPHSEYKGLNYKGKRVFDVWNHVQANEPEEIK